jgi:hypothetical protein
MDDFEVGQAVRCVNGEAWRSEDGVFGEGPRLGDRCIVSVVTIGLLRGEPTLAIGVAEYPLFRGRPCVFVARYFRPEGETEMQRFRADAASPPIKARELAEALP